MAVTSTTRIPLSPHATSVSGIGAGNRLTFVAIAALIAINLLCYWRSLSGYFLADDFVHIPYLAEVSRGHPELLLKNFVSNWMQTEGTQFYRPLISVTLAWDYVLWHGNALGFHATNIALQIASSIFLFLTSRRLTRSFAVGFCAGALFAVLPLHTEVVSWIIARVDSVATTFYLAAFWLFLRAFQEPERKWSYRGSLFCFVLSLLSKETAITLPAALATYALLSCREQTLTEKVRFALASTRHYWFMLFGYLIVRTAALGTFTGGYKGSIGSGLSGSILHRWLTDGSWGRVLYPLNAEVFAHGDKTHNYLRWLYTAASIAVAARLWLYLQLDRFRTSGKQTSPQNSGENPGSVPPNLEPAKHNVSDNCASSSTTQLKTWLGEALFAILWFAIAMIPAYQVWNLTATLQGARFIYMGTAPICLFLAVVLSPREQDFNPSRGRTRTFINWSCAVLMSLLLILCAVITVRNNEPWARAGEGVRALKESLEQKLDREMKPLGRIALIDLPQRYHGAHMLYNGSMLSILMSPPLCGTNYSQRILTFEPVMYGDSDLLNTTRIRRLAAEPETCSFYRWDEKSNALAPLNLVLPSSAALPSLPGNIAVDSEHPYISAPLNIPVLSTDFVRVDLTMTHPTTNAVLALSWSDPQDRDFTPEHTLAMPLRETTAPQTVTFTVSDRKRWVSSGSIANIRLSMPDKGSAAFLRKIELQNGTGQIPALHFDLGQRNSKNACPNENELGITWTGETIGPFSFDASHIPGAKAVLYELSQRDCWFDHYSGDIRDKTLAPEVLERGRLQVPRGTNPLTGNRFQLPSIKVAQAGYYEFRIFAVDEDGKTIGYSSDPINLWIEPPSKKVRLKPQGMRHDQK